MSSTSTVGVRAAQAGVTLTEYLQGADGSAPALDGGQRQQVVDALLAAVAGVYAHLPLKRAGYALDPVQALVLLRRRCADLDDSAFHLALTRIVTGLRDAHTRYRGPSNTAGRVAALPFLVETFGPDEDPTYIVSKLSPGADVDDPGFVEGVELCWWNAVPMARAVELHADAETGCRPDARRARALESLTFRALDYGPPPDEHWVVLGYRTPGGSTGEVTVPWRVLAPGEDVAASSPAPSALHVAADPARQAVRRARTLLFAPDAWTAGARRRRPSFDDVVTAAVLPGGFGHLRLWTFDVEDDDAYVDHVAGLLADLPPAGLVVDLRGNPGGLVWAAERLLQLLTDARIAPTRFSLLATPLTREMAQSPFNRLELGAWAASLDAAVTTGESYSQSLPLTDPEWCNDIGRSYAGPVVAVVDANTYSAGDLFAAGFVDHGIGPLVCVGAATGGGGANVWTDAQIVDALASTGTPLPPLPAGTGFTMSVRRAVRSGASDGMPIEDAGISGIPYAMTRDDLEHGNRDLLAFCAQQLELV